MFSHSQHKQIYQVILVLGLISFGLLVAAFGFQYFGGLAPCKLCIWQRWPHAAIMLFAVLGMMALRQPVVFFLIACAALGNVGIAGYHTGVELNLWPGPASCSAVTDNTLSGSEMLDILMQTPVVRCDQIVWSFLGLSMAGWNMVISLLQAIIALIFLQKVRG